jgi:isoleucyl-tRNA synthetase
VVALADDAALATLSFKPNLKTLGKRLGPKLKAATAEITAFTREQWHTLEQGGSVMVQEQAITKDDVLVSRTARGEVVIQSEGDLTVALDTTVTPALVREGLMRELVSRLQKQRKDLGLAVSDRIVLSVVTKSEELVAMLKEHDGKIREEVLAVSVTTVESVPGEVMDLDGHAITVQIAKHG